jgi:hypothetical protein
MDRLLFAGVMALRLLDAQSTHAMIARGNRDLILPTAITSHQPALYAFSIGAGAVEIATMIVLKRHQHRRIARALAFTDMGITAGVVAHNDSLGTVKEK